MHTLLTIVISHYNEKARWALERYGVDYREKAYLPLLHMLPVYLKTIGSDAAADKISSRNSTPVLVTDTGERICDSAKILRYVSDGYAPEGEGLYGHEEASRLEQHFHDALGPSTRRLAYFYIIDNDALLRKAARDNVGRAQATLFSALLPIERALMKKGLRIEEAAAMRSRQRILDIFSEVDAMLADGRPFLVGDRFSAADLAFSCMAAPALFVAKSEGYGAVLPSVDEVPEPAARFARELRATRAGEHAMRMFREHRGRLA